MATTREELQKSIKPYGRRRTYDKKTGEYAFSMENPYYNQMQFAKNKVELQELRDAAIEWEANNQQLQEQRAYDSPLAQIQRERAAGINPDLAGGSGSGGISAGSSAAMPMATPDMETPNAIDTANTVFSGISAVSNFVGTIASCIYGGLDFAKGVATFGDFVSQSASTSSIMDSQAKAMPGLLASQTNLQNAQADNLNKLTPHAASKAESEAIVAKVYADNAETLQKTLLEQNEYQAWQSNLTNMGNLAAILPPKEWAAKSEEEIAAKLKSLGYPNPEKNAASFKAYCNSPERQALYDEQTVRAREAKVKEVEITEAYLTEMTRRMKQIELYNSESSMALASFQAALSDLVFTPEQAQLVGSTMLTQNTVDAETVKLAEAQIRQDLNAFFDTIDSIEAQKAQLTKEIEAFDAQYKKTGSAAILQKKNAAIICRMNLDGIRSDNLREAFTIISNHYRSAYQSSQFIDGTGMVVPFAGTLTKHIQNFSNLVYGYQPDQREGIVAELVGLLVKAKTKM